jgi:hypothetical protein
VQNWIDWRHKVVSIKLRTLILQSWALVIFKI